MTFFQPQALKKGEHVYVSGELRYRDYDKEVGEGKDTVKMPVAGSTPPKSGGSIRRTSEEGEQPSVVSNK